MTSATLFREGDDLDELLAELDEEFPGQVRVVEVSYPRTGGIAGFFAKQKVAVEFTLQAADRPRRPGAGWRLRRPARPRSCATMYAADPIDDLLDEADARDGASVDAREDVRRGEGGGSNAEFAQLLLELAAKKAAARTAGRPGGRPRRIARE